MTQKVKLVLVFVAGVLAGLALARLLSLTRVFGPVLLVLALVVVAWVVLRRYRQPRGL